MGGLSSKQIVARINRQTDEIRAVKTQEQFNATLEKHDKENKKRLLLPAEEKKYEREIFIYELAIEEKRKELEKKFGSTIKGNEVPQLKL